MPASSVKQLYVAKCMKDLDSQSKIENTFKGKNTNILVISAEKVFKAAEASYIDKDEEKAYVQYTRFIELVLLLRKRKDFANHPDCKLLSRNAQTAIARAEDLKASLLKRYSILQEANCLAENEKNEMINSLQNNKPDVVVSSEQVTPEVELPKTEDVPELSISSSKLFSLLTNQQFNIILMDTRPPKDFEESHIKHSQCINIPQHLLEPGTTAMKLEGVLPPASLGKWYMRSEADYVILIDWDSKDESSYSLHLEVLKQAMSKWDQRCSLKKPPVILQGGYKDWMLKYPMYTTQALSFSSVNDFKTSSVIADVSGVEYPNLDEPDKTSANKENLNGPGMLFRKSNVPPPVPSSVSPVPSNVRNSKSAPVIDRKSKPTIDRSAKTSAGERKNMQTSTSNQSLKDERTTSGIPVLSRNNSEKADSSNKDKKELMSSLNLESSLAKENLEFAKQQLAKEQELENLRLQKELAAEENIRQEIQKREEQLIDTLKKLEIESRNRDQDYLKMKEENITLKKLLGEKSIKKEEDKEVQKQKEEILEAEKQKKAMQEYVEKLREQRKKQEIMNKRKTELAKTDVMPREVVSANTGLKRNLQDQNSQNSEYTVPLSRQSSTDSSGRGLVRSHSSPNIAQMVNQEESSQRKVPVVDRSLKPKAIIPSHQVIEINRARLRNLNPVYGNCPVRPATGLRNLGNTCFMNSIIQCLSNTIPLAEYFTSGQYMEDINRDSKSGTGGEVAEEFAVVIKSLWMGQYKSFSPKDFKNTVSRCLAVCIGNEQQDSHEFFVVLMEKLHADLNKRISRSVPKLESCADENTFWIHHKSLNSSRISDLFEGLLKSTLQCMTCRTTSDSFEVFSCLSLPILSSKCSLSTCFEHFLKSEKISGEAAWDCPKCKTKKEAEKRLRICRVPEILVIQLKRFSYEGLWRRKLQTAVHFDFQFDVPYEKNTEVYNRRYNLYGIVNHFGTLEGGHYTAYCNTASNIWFKYDDHEVSEINSNIIRTPAAYILFYRSSEPHSNL
ncbi:ubiquitin carboxyl-terminal hydrolase 8-like [Argiope bruennichi]|uniref:ubiquitinyl hydrolase 1 n=1 Tax=Argiope bruennichi TaxID=94029 RepID=A0A8T0FHY1_ARGBR|nr:ubiquitin carboxyl-terminal hydrolase 8-like [Argiope bruennichi]XP_055925214.1 ubiquitin carboxyl-terminal hydrolase 8-like [Argiope bruennichi]KAF8788453.1 Ubiquitin carboxyl-terminal hydrolase 8 like protein [Argiope bruennichi]